MADVVAKKFKTVNRRFEVGDQIVVEDIQGPISFDEWKERGFIKPADGGGVVKAQAERPVVFPEQVPPMTSVEKAISIDPPTPIGRR